MREIGNSPGAVPSPGALENPRLKAGDRPFPTEAPDADNAKPHGSEFERQMALAEAGMALYRGTLRALAG